MKSNYYLLSFAFVLPAIVILASEEVKRSEAGKKALESSSTAHEIEEQRLQGIFAKYNPTPEWCRPSVRASSSGSVEFVETAGEAFEFACMLKGYKKVGWFQEEDLLKMFPDLAVLKKYKQITTINVPATLISSVILYTPEGRKNAYLFRKYLEERSKNWLGHYIQGFLLGYLDKDIRAFYKRREEFVKDKEKAETWITENEPTIEEWAKSKGLE